jgi:DNA-binding NtrC family response regulator
MKKILLLEDDRSLAVHWQIALEAAGYHVFHESEYDSAMATLSEHVFELVITDILIRDERNQVGAKGGFSLLSHIFLNLPEKPKTIAISGGPKSMNLLGHAANLQANRTLSKPIAVAALIQEVADLIGPGR